jgi:hypothetical protein
MSLQVLNATQNDAGKETKRQLSQESPVCYKQLKAKREGQPERAYYAKIGILQGNAYLQTIWQAFNRDEVHAC